MSYLKFKTIANTNPRGKPKVYYCAHKDDYNKYFESVCNDLFKLYDCSIWYLDNLDIDFNEYEDDLKSMNLFVMPITTKLLTTENKVISKEFAFAIKNNIPVLPLMKEKNLDEQFNKVCGDLQYLDKFKKDDTGLTYQQKLKKFLSSIFINDELIEKIKAAFDAYVFLSYRKKDRKYAEQLMKLVHKNKFCQDIAIWYDEYLVPGENFNDAIKEALVKSDLFLLTVTPNLVNEDNYIVKVEYPLAKEVRKPILPVELVTTDKEKINSSFKDIPVVIDANNEVLLSETILNDLKKIAIETNNTPEHDFFIGLAYLAGIDVEVDYEKAVELITSSAEKGLLLAIDKLIEMYKTGIAVKRSFKKVLDLYEKKISILEEKLESNYSDELVKTLCENYILHGDYLLEILKYKRSKVQYEKALDLLSKYNLFEELLIDVYDKLAIVYTAELKYEEASSYYRKSYELSKKYYSNKTDDESINKLANSYTKLAKSYSLNANYDNAIKYYTKAIEVKKSVSNESKTDDFEYELVSMYKDLGNSYMRKSDNYNAQVYLEEAQEIVYKLCEKPNGIDYAEEYVAISLLLGDLYSYDKKFEMANIYYNNMEMTIEGLLTNIGTLNYELLYVDILLKRARLNELRNKKEDCYNTYKLAYDKIEKLYRISDTNKIKIRFHQSCLGLITHSKDIDESIKYYIIDKRILEQLSQSGDNINVKFSYIEHYETFGFYLYQHKKFDKALEQFLKSLPYYEEILKVSNTINNYRNLSLMYGKIAETYYQKYEDDKYKEYYEKQYQIRKDLLTRTNNVEQLLDYAFSCYKLSFMFDIDTNLSYAKEALSKLEEVIKTLDNENIRNRLANYYKRLAKIYEKLQDKEKAKEYLAKSEYQKEIVRKYQAAEEKLARVYPTIFLSKALFLKGEYKNLENYLRGPVCFILEIEDYALMGLNKEISFSFAFVSKTYEKLGRIEESLKYKRLSEYALNDLDNEELNYEFDDIRLLWIKENAEVKESHNEYEELSKWAEKGISILNKREKTLENKKELVYFYKKAVTYYEYYCEEKKFKAKEYKHLIAKELEDILSIEETQENYQKLSDAYVNLFFYYANKKEIDNMFKYLNKMTENDKKAHQVYNNDETYLDMYYNYSRYVYCYKKVLNDDAMASKYLSVQINKLKELVSRNPIKHYKELLESSFDTLNDWNLTYDENQKEL